MVYVGIDRHRNRSQIAVLAQDGSELLSRRIVNDPELFLEILAGLDEPRVAVEATYGWEWLADLLEDAGCELHLAHPLRSKAIASARVKTDAVDARTLAHLAPTRHACSQYRSTPNHTQTQAQSRDGALRHG
jgi:transposase